MMVQAELHQEPKKNRPALQPVQRVIKSQNNLKAQLPENREHPQLAEQVEVPVDHAALNRNIKKVT